KFPYSTKNGDSYPPEDRIGEILDRAPGRHMRLEGFVFRHEAVAQPRRQSRRTVALNRQTAAALRPRRRESGKNDGRAGTRPRRQCLYISVLRVRLDEEMKHGAVVPDIPGSGRHPLRDVGAKPG